MISVVIPNFNGARFLPMCLESIQRQTRRDIEIIVVDNHSQDESCALIRERYPEVRLIEMPCNAGFSVAVNRGIDAAGGEYVALFNNDAEADERWLEILSDEMTRDARIGICGSRIMFYFRRDTFDSAGMVIHDNGIAYNRGNEEKDEGQYDQRAFLFGASAAAVLYRKSMLEAIRLNGQVFDEDFHAYYEDSDVCFRSQLAGYQCVYLPDAVVWHIGSATNKRISIVKGKPVLEGDAPLDKSEPTGRGDSILYYGMANVWNLIIKNVPTRLLLREGWKMLLYEVFLVASILKKRKLSLYLSARWRLLKQLGKMVSKRRLIQSRRVADDERIASLLTRKAVATYGQIIRKALGRA